MNRTILIFDRDRELLSALYEAFKSTPHRLLLTQKEEEAESILSKEKIDLLVTEVEFEQIPSPTLCILTADEQTFGKIAGNVANKIYDHFPRPIDVRSLTQTMERALETIRLQIENTKLREALSHFDPTESIQRTLSACQLLKLTLETIYNLLKPEAAVLFLRDAITGRYEIRDFCSRDPKVLSEVIGTPDLVAIENAVRNQDYLHAEGESTESFFRNKPSFGKILELYSFPAQSQGHLFGFINVYQFTPKNQYWGETPHALLAALAKRVAGALSGASHFDSVQDTFKSTIRSLAQALDRKDSYTAGHSDRTQIFVSMLLNGLEIPALEKELILDASQLHDIGKLSVDLSALNNPGKLSLEEIESFRSHPTYGKELLEPIFFLSDLIPMVYHHHESFDGTGYPRGLKGDEIPLGARIISIADSYDAMTSNRAYRRAYSHERSVKELKKYSGSQFDPELVRIFIEQIKKNLEEQSILKLLPHLADDPSK